MANLTFIGESDELGLNSKEQTINSVFIISMEMIFFFDKTQSNQKIKIGRVSSHSVLHLK